MNARLSEAGQAMTLREIFRDPLNPGESLQLNNKYWPGDRYSLLGLIADGEALVREGNVAAAARQLRLLEKHFGDAAMYTRFLQRLHRLHSSRSDFGCVVGRLELPAEVLEANRYSGSEMYAVYPLQMAAAFSKLDAIARQRYCAEYGRDFLRMNSTVRFAAPGEKVADMQSHGLLSDYHNDEYKGISAIAYLSDVNEENNGAFSYLRGSELIPRSMVLLAIHQCVFFDMQLRTVEQLKAVPLEFRSSTAIGNFLEDDKVRIISPFREVLLGPAGTYIAFNGQYLVHRGGKPLTGSRTAAFLQPEGMLRLKLRGFRSRLFGFTHH